MNTAQFWLNRRVVITGGSQGLGRALAGTLTEFGAKVAIIARDKARLAQAKAEVPSLHTIQGDVADKDAIYRIAGETIAALESVDTLIHNASALGPTPLRLLADTECEDLEAVWRTNVLGPFRLTKAFLPSMLLGKGGLIVGISSDAAVTAYPRWGAYGASKAAFDQLLGILDIELKSQGVRAFAVDPGDMDTALHHAAVANADPDVLAKPRDVARALAQFLPQLQDLNSTRWSAEAWRRAL